jgi:predicted Zn-dependent protease
MTLLAPGERSEIRNPKSETDSKDVDSVNRGDASGGIEGPWRLRRSILGIRVALLLGGVGIAWFMLLAARTLVRQGEWKDQRTFVVSTISAGGDSPRMLMNLANVESNTGNDAKAIALYREALRRSPDQPVIWMGFASVLARAGDIAGAREALAHATNSPLLHADCLQLEASLAKADGKGDPRELWQQAVAAAPANWPLRKRYVEFLGKNGDLTAARADLAAFLRLYPFRSETWKMFAQTLEKTGEGDLARIANEQAARRDVRMQENR